MQFADVFQPILFTIIVAAGLLAWAWMIDCWRHRQVLLPQELHSVVPWEGIDVVMVISMWLVVGTVCVEVAIRWLGTPLPKDPGQYSPQQQFAVLGSQFIGSMATFFLAVVFIKLRTGASLAALGFDFQLATYDVKIGAIAFSAVAPVVFAIQALLTNLLPYEHAVKSIVEQRPTTIVLTLLGLSTILIAPLTEEFFFRVVLQGWLEKAEIFLVKRTQRKPASGERVDADGKSGDLIAGEEGLDTASGLLGCRLGFLPIVGSSILFALMHLGQGPAMVPLFVLAMVLGTLYQRTHRILPSFTVHCLLNAVSMAMLFAGDPTQQQVGN